MGSDRALAQFRERMDQQMRSGVYRLVLLSAVERLGPVYGYELLKAVNGKATGRLEFKEGTAYPILRKLEDKGLVSSFWQEGEAGPPRKYYQITDLGQRALDQAVADWRGLGGAVDDLLADLDDEEARA